MRFARDKAPQAIFQGISWKDGWYWWVIEEMNWAEDKACRLPPKLWNRLVHSFPYEPSVFKEYPTLRSAYEALFEAWPAFAPIKRVIRKREGAR